VTPRRPRRSSRIRLARLAPAASGRQANVSAGRDLPVPGYVYGPREGAPRAGFGRFKALGAQGFKLWLVAAGREFRRQGHGRAMRARIAAVRTLASPRGCAPRRDADRSRQRGNRS
jgi:GNAT superfamily N-acetyltransferase